MTPRSVPASRPLRRFFLSFLHLCALGVLGWFAVSALAVLASLGIGLLVIVGLGLLFLVALVYALYGLGAFEVERVSGLYDLDIQPLTFSARMQPGVAGYAASLGRQMKSGRMWTSVGSLLISTLIGTVILVTIQASLRGMLDGVFQVASAFGPTADYSGGNSGLGPLVPTIFPWAVPHGPAWSVLFALVMLAIAGCLVFLARLVSVSIIGSSAATERLSEQARVAAENARVAEASAAAQTAQRTGAVRAAYVERARIERDLHDGIQPRLVSVGMTLGLARQQIDRDPEKARELIAEAHSSTKAAITELRQLARGIHASVLDDRGLDAALSALAGRSVVPVDLDVRLYGPDGRLVQRVSREAETAVYFAIAEALTNAAKHSAASSVRVTVRIRPPHPSRPSVGPFILWAQVVDNGVGGARLVSGGGLDGIANRALAAGGTVHLDSPVGGPTTLEVSVPCAF